MQKSSQQSVSESDNTEQDSAEPNQHTPVKLPGPNTKNPKTNISEEDLLDAATSILNSAEKLKKEMKLKSRAKVLTKSFGQVKEENRPECILKLIEIAKRYSS